MKQPKYGHHKATNRGRAVLDGKSIYFPGEYNSAESLAAYEAWCDTLKSRAMLSEPISKGRLKIAELAYAYIEHCKTYYGDGQRSTTANIRLAIKEVTSVMGLSPIADLGPKKLKAIRESMIERDLGRRTINDRVGWIKAWFKWAASEELIHIQCYQALCTVKDLPRGRSKAKDNGPRKPADLETVELAIEQLSGVTKAMVRLQVYTGARSGSVVLAHKDQFVGGPKIEVDGEEVQLMLWKPRHKNEHLGQELILPIGPKCQEVLKPFLEKAEQRGWLFSPQDCGRRSVKYNEHYSTTSYRRAVVRAQERIERDIIEANEKKPKAEHQPIPERWTPHQLRHALGHTVRDEWGVEAAQAMLGHSNLDSTQVYSERRVALACQVAAQIG